MPPSLALFFWFVLLIALLWFDPAKEPKTSSAIWVPVIWMFIVGSRLPSQWLGGQMGQAAQSLEEGSTFDRYVYLGLIAIAISILISRSFRWDIFFGRNLALMFFVLFALVSVLWSDFAFVAFKRWFRDVGNYLVVIVALSDLRPLKAVQVVLRRVSYLLIPLSIVLIKYYPQLGKQYSVDGGDMYVGVTTGKNLLGVVCLVGGLFFFWDTIRRWNARKEPRTTWIILINCVFLLMALWLLNLAKTATSNICMFLGCALVAAAHFKPLRRRPAFLKVMVPAFFCVYVILAFGFNLNGRFAGAVGKDPTLTDRTQIWAFVLHMHTNPLIGTGYESFWLGSRLQLFWHTSGLGFINEAHNGFLELYLNLGLVGVGLMIGYLITSYRTIWSRLSPVADMRSLALALWIDFLFYNMTEAGFRSGLMWLIFLLATLSVPGYAKRRLSNIAVSRERENADTVSCMPLEPTPVAKF